MLSLLAKIFCRNATALRARQAPEFIFLRNYKASHKDRLERVIRLAHITKDAIIVKTAYDSSGNIIPEKVAVYARCKEIEAIFFLMYSRVKSEEKAIAQVNALT